MEYRLLCIYKCDKGVVEQVDIEVNRELHSSTLGPFMRKVSVEKLVYGEVTTPKNLVWLLNQYGYDKQPFVLKGNVLNLTSVQVALSQNKWSYKQEGHGSLKKTTAPPIRTSYSHLPILTPKGGELYITNPANWKSHIKVRILYADAVRAFFPVYNDLPCRTSDGTLFARNEASEREMLEAVMPYMESNGLDISLPSFDVDYLRSLTEKGWKIYVADGKAKASEVHAHQNKSGIVWFDRNEKVEDDNGIISQMLDGYLHGRNYKGLGSNLELFRSDDVVKQKDKSIVSALIADDGSVEDIYTANTPLTTDEKESIDWKIENGINARLYDYQLDGVYWLATMRKNHKGCLLADEMGLGKTIQVLSHLYAVNNPQGSFLIVAPTSLLSNWENEIRKFIPSWADSIVVQSHNPSTSSRIILVSYDILRLNISAYSRLHYDTVVIDEAQIVKNRDTQKYRTIVRLNAYHRIILTGTPIENSINDIWSHFMILMPPLRRVFKAVTKNDASLDSPQFMELSKKILKPFILRRTKEEVQRRLPKLEEEEISVELSLRERSIYNMVKSIFLKALHEGISGRLNSIALEGLLRLRQTCVSPNLLPHTLYNGDRFVSSKMKEALNMIHLFAANGDKTLVFSQFVGALQELEGYLDMNYVHLYGDTTNRKACVDAFQSDPSVKVFLISLKAGGVGLNLTAATRVILLDDWWNPAVESQAFARAHRIGQDKDVKVYRLVCKDTVEEKILKLQDKKRQTVDMFNTGGGKLTLEELKGLLG